jgi:hypothetical protein
MVVRSLNGLNGSTTNVIITNHMDAALPLEQTQANTLSPIVLSIKGLSTMGAENQIMKVNSSGVLAWATDNNNVYTGTAPIIINSSTKNITYDNDTVAIFNYKTFGNMTTFNNGLEVKYLSDNTNSGYVRFWDDNNSNYIDLHTTQGHSLLYSGNMFLPTPISNGDTVIVSRNSTDTLTNKTITSFIGVSSATITAPSNTGTLALANSTIAFGDDGLNPVVRSYIFDPRKNSGTPTSVYNVLSYHENGTETAINNWSAGNGGLSSHISFNFGGAMKFRFHTDETIKVGSKAYSFPTNAGTLAVFSQIPTNNNQLTNGAGYITSASIPSAIWSVSSNIISPTPTTVNRLKLFGADTAVYGDITNPLSPNFGYINTGAFYDLRANNCASETFIVSKFYGGSPVQYAQTTLTCSQGENLLLSGNSIAEFYDQDNSISWIQDASLSNKRILTFFSSIQSGNTSYCCAFKNGSNATNYPMIKNNNGDFVLHMRGVGDYLQLTTAGVLNTWSHTVNGTLKVSNKIVMIGSACSITGDTIANPFIPGQFYISYISSNLIYSADITVKLLRVADVNNVGNYFESQLTCVNNRLKINTPVDITGALTTTGDITITGKLICVSNHLNIQYISSLTYLYNPSGTHAANNGGEATAAGSYISYHDNGSAIYLNIPNGATGAGNYISFATGNTQKMRIEMNGDLYVCGAVYDNTCPSDSRLKHNQKVYDKNATDILNKIVIKDFMKSQIINFNDKDPNDTSKGMKPFYERLCPMEDCKYDIGVIAQELYEIPELSFMVHTENWSEERPATISNWNPLISLLIKSNQEQETKIIKLETELDTLKTENQIYKSIVDKLINSKTFVDFKKSIA